MAPSLLLFWRLLGGFRRCQLAILFFRCKTDGYEFARLVFHTTVSVTEDVPDAVGLALLIDCSIADTVRKARLRRKLAFFGVSVSLEAHAPGLGDHPATFRPGFALFAIDTRRKTTIRTHHLAGAIGP